MSSVPLTPDLNITLPSGLAQSLGESAVSLSWTLRQRLLPEYRPPVQLHQAITASSSKLADILSLPFESGGLQACALQLPSSQTETPQCPVHTHVDLQLKAQNRCMTPLPPACSTMYWPSDGASTRPPWLHVDIKAAWQRRTPGEVAVCPNPGDSNGAIAASVEVNTTYRLRPSARRDISLQAIAARTVCDIRFRVAGSPDVASHRVLGPLVVLVPADVSIPDDARLSTDTRSAVQVSSEGKSSLQVTTSGGQNMTIEWRNDTEAARRLTHVTMYAGGVQASGGVKQTDASAGQVVVTLPRTADLWTGSCAGKDLPASAQRRASFALHMEGRAPAATIGLTLRTLYLELASMGQLTASHTALSSVLTADRLLELGAEAAVMLCPPYCPGTSAIDWPSSAAVLEEGAVVRTNPIQYVCQCTGYAFGAVCMDADVSRGQCAWGEGDDCRRCPTGAVCPGGYRLWPQPGYWAATAASESVVECVEPNRDRCDGWSAQLGRSVCAAGHDPASPQCRGCLPRYYPNDPNECTQCPAETDLGSQIVPALTVVGVLMGGIAGVVLVPAMYILHRLRHVHRQEQTRFKEAAKIGMKQLMSFGVWILQLVSVIIQAARYLPSTMPGMLRVPLQALAPLLLDLPTIHPSCLGESPIQKQVTTLAASVTVAVLVLVLWLNSLFGPSRLQGKAVAILGHVVHMVSLLLYPIVASTVVEVLDCRTIEGELVWWSNVYVRCYEGVHTGAAVVAFMALTLHLTAVPSIAVVRLWRAAMAQTVAVETGEMAPSLAASVDNRLWRYYVSSDMQPRRFWYYHVLYASQVVVAVDTQLLRDRIDASALMWVGWTIVVIMCIGRIAFITTDLPYIQANRWMVWPEVGVLLCVMLLRSSVVAMYTEGVSTIGRATEGMALMTVVCLLLTLAALVMVFMLAVRTRVDSLVAHREAKARALEAAGATTGLTKESQRSKLGRLQVFSNLLQASNGERSPCTSITNPVHVFYANSSVRHRRSLRLHRPSSIGSEPSTASTALETPSPASRSPVSPLHVHRLDGDVDTTLPELNLPHPAMNLADASRPDCFFGVNPMTIRRHDVTDVATHHQHETSPSTTTPGPGEMGRFSPPPPLQYELLLSRPSHVRVQPDIQVLGPFEWSKLTEVAVTTNHPLPDMSVREAGDGKLEVPATALLDSLAERLSRSLDSVLSWCNARTQSVSRSAMGVSRRSSVQASLLSQAEANTISVLRFQQLMRDTGPAVYAQDARAMLDIFHRINTSGSGQITAAELAAAVRNISDPVFLSWLLSLSAGQDARLTQVAEPQ